MKIIFIAVLLATLACVTQADRKDVCNKDMGFHNLMFRFSNKGNTPMFHYWLTNDNMNQQYKITFDRLYAFRGAGVGHKFSRQMLSSWDWELRDCTLYCDSLLDNDHNMCEFFFDGNNGQALDSADRMDMTINVQIQNVSNVQQFKFGINVSGNEMKNVLDNYNT